VIPKKSTVSRIITPDIARTTHHLRFAAVISGTAAELTMPEWRLVTASTRGNGAAGTTM